MFNPFNLIARTGSLSQPRFCRSNYEIWLTRVDFIGEVRARLGSLQRPRDPDSEGLGGKLFCHKGTLQDFPSWLRAIWWDVALTGARGCSLPSGGGPRVGGEVGWGRTPVPTIFRRLSSAAFLSLCSAVKLVSYLRVSIQEAPARSFPWSVFQPFSFPHPHLQSGPAGPQTWKTYIPRAGPKTTFEVEKRGDPWAGGGYLRVTTSKYETAHGKHTTGRCVLICTERQTF